MHGFRHVVTLSFDGATDAQVDEVVAGLAMLPAMIPAIGHYEVGRDAGLAAGNAAVVVVADFSDQAEYEVYRDHPDHQRVISDTIRPILTGRSAVQHVRTGVDDGAQQ